MKLLIEVTNKEELKTTNSDGIILSLENYSVESTCFYTLEEIKNICKNTNKEVFVKVNKNFMNEDIEPLKGILIELDKLNIKGLFFYDLAIIQLKKELNLNIDLVWNQTHMVNNYKTCNYYYSKGVKYALLGKEITLEEIKEIIDKSNITTMVEVISRPSVAFSKRKLVSNYYKNLNIEGNNTIQIEEKATKDKYDLIENNDGTSFFLDTITNGTSIIKELFNSNCPYIIIREFGLEEYFSELVLDTINYIKNNCNDDSYIEKYKKIGNSTNFFFRKTIYRVKKK